MMSDAATMSSPAAETGATGLEAILDQLLVGPMLPATLLAGICLLYLFVALLGAVDLGLDGGADLDVAPDMAWDADLDVSPDLHAGGETIAGDWFGGIGATTLRAVNLDRVPVMIWVSTFSLLFWMVSYLLWFEFDARRYAPTLLTSGLLIIRNAVVAVLGTKLLTYPLHRLLRPARRYDGPSLIGDVAVVDTGEVDGRFGRARYAASAAPLLLNIRTRGETLLKGEVVQLLEYDRHSRFYTVARMELSPSGEEASCGPPEKRSSP